MHHNFFHYLVCHAVSLHMQFLGDLLFSTTILCCQPPPHWEAGCHVKVQAVIRLLIGYENDLPKKKKKNARMCKTCKASYAIINMCKKPK